MSEICLIAISSNRITLMYTRGQRSIYTPQNFNKLWKIRSQPIVRLQRFVIWLWKGNFNSFQSILKKNLKNVFMKCNFYYSGKWEIQMLDFGGVRGGTGVCHSTCLYGPLLIASRSLHKQNFMQKCPGTFLGEIVKLWILHKNDWLFM